MLPCRRLGLYPAQSHRYRDNNPVSGGETSTTQPITILHGVWHVDCQFEVWPFQKRGCLGRVRVLLDAMIHDTVIVACAC